MALSKIQAESMNLADTYAFTGTVSGTGGITMVDVWRMTGTYNTNETAINNWEQQDDVSFSNLGTAMSHSSGIFTFPETGLYQISAYFQGTAGSGDNSVVMGTQISSDSGSTYDFLAKAIGGSAGQSYTASSNTVVNVTDASTFRCRFYVESLVGSSIYGDTDYNRSAATFIRLADAQ